MADASQSPHLSVVIPVYNEAKGIAESMRRVEAYMNLRKYSWELLVVSDGSTDETDKRVREFIASRPNALVRLLSAERNHGKGFAARRGVLEARGGYILLTDADLSSPIKEVDKLIRALEGGADMAIASRVVREEGADVRQCFKRWLSGRIFNYFVRLFVIRGIKDTQCGFKCFKSKPAHALFGEQKLEGFAFDVEILYLAKRHGYAIKEVSVMWRQGPDSRVSLLKDSLLMLGDLFKIRRLHSLQ